MKDRLDLTNGSISDKLIKLALPIMGTSLIQMAYNLTDMMWVGRVGSNAVAAVGTAGFYPWLAMAFIMISRVGGEVKVAQSIGENNIKHTKSYIKAAIEINIILSVIYSAILIIFNKNLIGLFKLGDLEVISMSRQYLIIIACGMIFYFINPVFTAIFNGLGNSKTPFRINTIGLIANIILDPILIFGWMGLPKLGVVGAAIATITAQIIVTICFVFKIVKNKDEFFKIKFFTKIEIYYYKVLYKLGLPVAIQNGMFTLFSMAIGVIVASWGPVAIAVQKVGSQIESISWMTADGLAVALGSFVGQNYGAKNYDRINKSCKIGILTAIGLGIITTLILVFWGEDIFTLFISEKDAVTKGGMYLKILGYSQLFMCFEIIISGAFKGLGRTYISSIIVTILTGARIPMAYLLSKPEILGLNGIWWSISLSSIFKGILLLAIFIVLIRNNKLYSQHESIRNFKEEIASSSQD
ncbi:MATE family efflux transporter [Romboutsia ilealis]|uniref:Probable multidrug resistance protein NorM n=1 Tax=Romboutsia faecis TaxID=2764597 RepID=A0ABR7JN99_9FIRM|nr:MATE family efflux transporter [Romboutsia faecis]MBC5996401.1 MATE family efflux transporter [Romboutsia faecis]MRN26020.1 MATE family efflux transporter [Romboutsia ilealis]